MNAKKMAKQLLTTMNQVRQPKQPKAANQLTGSEAFVVAYLEQQTVPVHPGDLVERLGVTTAGVATILRGLERHSLVVRQPDQADRRKTIVSLTATGQQVATAQAAQQLTETEKLVHYLGEADTAAYIRILEKMAQYQKDNA